MDATIQHRTSRLEQEFLDAISSNDTTLLRHFESVWLKLQQDVEASTGSLTSETLGLVYASASRISILADALMQLQARSDVLSEQLHSDLQDTMSQASPLDCNSIEPNGATHAPYIEEASRWLYDNLHNPYPSAETRRRLAHRSNSPEKDISAWFIEARKRIGWNNLRKQHFSNKRADIVDAATRFFQSDYANPVPERIESAFVEIQMKAQRLHHDKFEESRLATALDCVVRDMSTGLKQQSTRRKSRNPSRTKVHPGLAYPSPESSPSRSPEPESPASTVLDNDWFSLKRDRSCTPCDEFSSERSSKRQRTTDSRHGLLSPALSLFEHDLSSPSPEYHSSPLEESSTPHLPRPSTKRKRESLDTDDRFPSKRSNPPPAQTPTPTLLLPQVKTVPLHGPSPGPFADDLWITSMLDTEMPGPVTVDSLDTSEPLELELFDFSTSYPLMQLGQPIGNPYPRPNNFEQDIALGWLDQEISSIFHFACNDFQTDQTGPVSDGQTEASFNPELWGTLRLPSTNTHCPDLYSLQEPLPSIPESVSTEVAGSISTISTSTTPHLSESDRAEKTKLLLDLEAQWLALRAELASA